MIRFLNNLFILENSYFRYVMGIDENKRLYHSIFLPVALSNSWNLENQRQRLAYPYPFEVLVNVNDESLQCWHGVRYFWSNSSYRAEYQRHSIVPIFGGSRLIVTLLDKTVNMEIQLNYDVFEDSPALLRYTTLTNLSETPIKINHISSFVLGNFPYDHLEESENDLFLHQFRSQWSWEGSHDIDSFDQLGVFKSGGRGGYTVESLSSYPCQHHFPYFIIEERRANLFWGIQMENCNPWRFEIGTAEYGYKNWIYAQGGMENESQSGWYKLLNPKESFSSPHCSLTVGKDNIENIYNQFHLHQQKYLIHRSILDQSLPVIYNDWQFMFGSVDEEKIIQQLPFLQQAGVECYVIDAGWFCSPDQTNPQYQWWNMVGDWQCNSDRFPHGLAYIANQIKKHDMIPGIWCEIEAVGNQSNLYHQQELLMIRNGRPVEDINRRFLYFGNETGRQYAMKIFEQLIDFGFQYFKIDSNIDAAPGCTNSGNSPGQGLVDHRNGYNLWLDELRQKYPKIIIENCSSGGMRLEYSMLSRTDLASITDQENPNYVANILAQVSKLIHPSQCGNWSALKNEFSLDNYAFTLAASMMGRMQLSGDIAHHDRQKKELVKQAIQFYKSYRHLLKAPYCHYYTPDLKAQEQKGFLAYEYRSMNNDELVLYSARLANDKSHLDIQLSPLKEGVYEFTNFPDHSTGFIDSRQLKERPIHLDFKSKHTANVLYLRLNTSSDK